LPDPVSVPLLDDLAPDGFFYGGHYIVEFDPDSLWYETSLAITASALKKGIKTEYHVFQHFPNEAAEGLSRLGIDTKKLEADGLLSFWDSYSATVEYEKEKERLEKEKGNLWSAKRNKPLDVRKTAKNWTDRVKAGYSDEDKRWLHIDDNTAIFLQYNDEEDIIDSWRTTLLPFAIRARETPHFLAFVKGAGSESFFTKFEALCDGIIDLKAAEENGQITQYIRIRMLRGKIFDARWHRIELANNGEVKFLGSSSEGSQRRLAAIMFTDLVGYTSLSQKNEALALELLEKNRELLRSIFPKYRGKEVKTMGDAFLVEFESALDAVNCAFEIQKSMQYDRNGSNAMTSIRIGIHLGDVIHKGNDVYGDAVNIASRIEPLSDPGGICISEQVFDHVRNKFTLPLASMGRHQLKNVDIPVEVFEVHLPWRETTSHASVVAHDV
jgi:class 3 adenylate cyclase